MSYNKTQNAVSALAPIKEGMESVFERCPQFIHPKMASCVLLTEKEWENLKAYIRLFRGREEELLLPMFEEKVVASKEEADNR